eukprot:TRINITY_DN1661_c0_g1_i2.p1 TRINITY_DN1661_c0_g1~~TRINITY_DN1661_c0_g1_i2.p1  ORF type:complete len:402 (+),score=46.44 TRINITY_DN1661_c0_g1_i2:102-1307(+)
MCIRDRYQRRVREIASRMANWLLRLVLLAASIHMVAGANCAFTNAHTASTGAYISVTSIDGETLVSGEATYGSTVWFNCLQKSYAGVAYSSTATSTTTSIVGGAIIASFGCEAMNMMILRPSSYGSSTSFALEYPSSTSALAAGYLRLWMLNSAYDGDLVWKRQISGSSTWTEIGSTTGFGGQAHYDMVVESTAETWLVRAEDATTSTVVASSSSHTTDQYDRSMGTHLHLMGGTGSEVLTIVRGCRTAESNCNACHGPSLSYWLLNIFIAGSLLLLMLAWLPDRARLCLRRRGPQEYDPQADITLTRLVHEQEALSRRATMIEPGSGPTRSRSATGVIVVEHGTVAAEGEDPDGAGGTSRRVTVRPSVTFADSKWFARSNEGPSSTDSQPTLVAMRSVDI